MVQRISRDRGDPEIDDGEMEWLSERLGAFRENLSTALRDLLLRSYVERLPRAIETRHIVCINQILRLAAAKE